jgi:hypothetical protein
MGVPIKDLPDGHYAKTPEAVAAAIRAEEAGCELQIDTAYDVNPFGNGHAYVLFGPEEEDGLRDALEEFADPSEVLADKSE